MRICPCCATLMVMSFASLEIFASGFGGVSSDFECLIDSETIGVCFSIEEEDVEEEEREEEEGE